MSYLSLFVLFSKQFELSFICDYLKYVRGLTFEETPDYTCLVEGFKREIKKLV